ncbi:hypothetical protein SISSUDRAFT_638664 [Sistotremastrum suecicum HHB10207 ss-3]|uniref:Uncharacterized protein n=1 Tax=Sistotremastrum suecicum HHB10207 ss-3 TaxID=1314776 RepID=A0A166EBG1_9AGAM|nr:hypothetical protein SISSUDRAFT_638664 [Sistotremastrum suecicum HHB10207 ss-3]
MCKAAASSSRNGKQEPSQSKQGDIDAADQNAGAVDLKPPSETETTLAPVDRPVALGVEDGVSDPFTEPDQDIITAGGTKGDKELKAKAEEVMSRSGVL